LKTVQKIKSLLPLLHIFLLCFFIPFFPFTIELIDYQYILKIKLEGNSGIFKMGTEK